MKRNIGIFLGYGPAQLGKNHGIVKLLFSLYQSEEFRRRTVVALPSWCIEDFNKIVPELGGVKEDEFVLITTSRTKPLILKLLDQTKKIADAFINFRKRKRSKNNRFGEFADFFIKVLIKTPILLIALAPVFIFSYLIYFFFGSLFSKLSSKYFKKYLPHFKLLFLEPLSRLKENALARRIYKHMREDEIKKLIKKLNRRKDIDLWYVPAAVWSEAKHIKKKKVIAIPDIVYRDFPAIFTNFQGDLNYRQIQDTLGINAHFVCYNQHVKNEHLVKPYHINENRVAVIKHGFTDLVPYLSKNAGSITDNAIEILETFQKDHLRDNPYLANFYLPSMKYIFYSSQVRPHKNMVNLVKAYEILMRKRFINFKLVLTGNPKHDPRLSAYIHSQRLHNDVISLYNVSNEVLAALNHLAICAVNPTLFEGGFPFTFCEAYSVGTPSVMSRIPAVMEESHDEELNAIMLFDPYKVEEIANKIEWGIKHRDQLLELQKPLYNKFAKRSWECTAKDYLNLFDAVTTQTG